MSGLVIFLLIAVVIALVYWGIARTESAKANDSSARRSASDDGARRSPSETIASRPPHAVAQPPMPDRSGSEHRPTSSTPGQVDASLIREGLTAAADSGDQSPHSAPLERLTGDQIVASVMDRQRRLDTTMEDYVMWRQKYLDTGCRLPRAVDEFNTTLGILEGIQQDLARWRRTTKDSNAHEALDILDDSLAKALPPVRLMIEKVRMISRR